MRYYPEKDDQQELELLHADSWQIELLKKNPSYLGWGNYEDYMWKKGSGWDCAVELKSWSEHWKLDELNELVNFYFEVYRENHKCEHCEGSAYNKATFQLSEDFYDFQNTGRRWCDNITQDEVVALQAQGRLEKRSLTAHEVNQANKKAGLGYLNHDGINRWILIETRAKRLGIWGTCEHCYEGYIYDEPKAKVGLQLWMIHPRKGCSRGVFIKEIKENEVPKVIKYLKKAAERNQERFSKL